MTPSGPHDLGQAHPDDTVDARVAAGPDPLELRARWVVAERYEILGLLGSGGMGTVYRARDRELDEVVALKMLKKQIAASPGILERFRREVKLARRVTHRNVARTFDIGDHAGGKFLTMEFIDGEMLGAMLARRGRLRVPEVARIGRDLCAGLAAAHAAGVLHRDLKPANVVVTRDGRAVITDFGIARALAVGESTRTSGGVVGTPAYMAPEQLEGAEGLDERTDIYALGAMLFELLSGDVPWAHESPVHAALARLQQPPPDLRAERPSLPEAIATLVQKCMARHREDRFASADEVSAALEGLVTPGGEGIPSMVPSAPRIMGHFVRTTLIVVPIVNDGDSAHDYLADSLTEDLSDVLDGIPEVQVMPRQHAVRSPEAAEGPVSIGRACGVHAVIDGTLRREADRVRVALRLTTVEDGIELWRGVFDRAASETVAIADAAATAIAEALTTKAMATPRTLPKNALAHDLYLQGRYLFLRSWYDAKGDAVRLLAEAHMLAPADATIAATYARALARSDGVESLGEEAAAAAEQMAEKALVLDPRRADAHLALALVHLYRGEAVSAARALRRAHAIAPQSADVLEMLGRMRAEVGPLDRAFEHLGAALAREPAFAEARYTMARAWALLGERARCEDSLGPMPTAPRELVPHLLTSARLALWWRDPRRVAQLAAHLPKIDRASRQRGVAELLLGVGARGALTDTDRALLAGMLPSGSTTGQRLASFHAQLRAEVHLAGGENDSALLALRDADANGLMDISWLERCPLLDSVRRHPDVEAIRRSTALRAARVSDVLDGK